MWPSADDGGLGLLTAPRKPAEHTKAPLQSEDRLRSTFHLLASVVTRGVEPPISPRSTGNEEGRRIGNVVFAFSFFSAVASGGRHGRR